MESYLPLLKVHKPDSNDSKKPNHVTIDTYRERVGEGLIDLWGNVGFCSFENGLFWLTDPSEWQSVLVEFSSSPKTAIPIIRSSFGDIVYITRDGSIRQIKSLLGKDIDITFDIDMLFLGLMRQKGYSKDAFYGSLHKEAYKKLGEIKTDECYGFEPLLSLGGTEDVENMVKFKAREHLSLIAQTF